MVIQRERLESSTEREEARKGRRKGGRRGGREGRNRPDRDVWRRKRGKMLRNKVKRR